MITGVVRAREACIRLGIRGPGGREREIEAVIDTGFAGWLTIPPALVTALHLPWRSIIRGVLADGSQRDFDVYDAAIVWDGRVRRIPVNEANANPLVGMALLAGYELKMQVRSRGKVTIKPLP
jgi:clan AA aspartic protease